MTDRFIGYALAVVLMIGLIGAGWVALNMVPELLHFGQEAHCYSISHAGHSDRVCCYGVVCDLDPTL